MTTPERLRRRQLIEGAVLILLGIAMLLQTWHFNNEDRQQRECIAEKFTELTASLEVRANLSERETGASERVWRVYAEAAGLLRDDPLTPLPQEDQERLQRELVDALISYQSEIDKVERERKENPVPPFPVGVCER